jgi:alpha-tubulin suppressor-like RCC1 family protein
VLVDGSVYCWGANDVGQLGEFVGDASLSPTSASAMLGPGTPAVDVSATRQTCAVLDGGSAVCWGDNASSKAAPADMAPVVPPAALSFIAAATIPATGGSHSCIAREDGTLVTCFGANESGQLTAGIAPGPVSVAALFQFAEVELGAAFGCGRQATGEVWCWGSNASGQLATEPGVTPMSDTLLTVALGGAAADLAVGRNHACARVADVVSCWGANNVGQLGDGSMAQQNAPVPAMLPAGAVSKLEAGPDHTCAVLGTGELWCWGSNQGDQLLIERGPDEFSPTPVLVPTGDLVIEDVTGGVEHACVLTDTHQVHCWGPNTQGEAGVGMAGYVFAPTPIDLQCP